MRVELTVNGAARRLDVAAAATLLDVLRHDLGLKGAKLGCGAEQCGACKALVNGVDRPSCQLPVSQLLGARITTVEGLGINALKEAFRDENAAQCGYCTAGMIIAGQALLYRSPKPTDAEIRQALERNLCRCGVYDRIRRAIRRASGNPDAAPAWEMILAEPLKNGTPERPTSPSLDAYPQLDAWLRVNADETITVFSGKVELGQGIRTALAQIAAEELDVALERIRIVSGDTARSPDEGGTTGSRSLETSGVAIRLAAAAARRHLLSLAFEELASLMPAMDLRVDDGVVSDPISGRRTSYWQMMAGKKFGRLVVESTVPKRPAGHQLVGEAARPLDLADKLTGGPVFIHDRELPGMLHARVLRPPGYHARLKKLDIAAIEALPGIVRVVQDGGFVAVVAEREDEAARGLELAAELAEWEWTERLPQAERIYSDLLGKPATTHAIVDGVAQDPELGEAPATDQGDFTVSATYRRPFQMHASLGASAALAWMRDGELTVWSHSQAPFILRAALAQVLELDEAAARVIHAPGAGCYGHNGADDAALDAALVARAMPGRPISLAWTRADEHAWEPYGSAMLIKLGADLSAEGMISRWHGDIWSYAHSTRPAAGLETSGLLAAWSLRRSFERQEPKPMGGTHSGAHRNADPIYDLPAKRILRHAVHASPLRISALRSLGAYANVFAIESFMDELAAAADLDPLDYRLMHLGDERARAVLLAAAQKANWRERARENDTGWGMALAQYKNLQAYAAILVKLRVERATGAIRLLRTIIAADAGQVVNPDGLSNQLEGGFVQAASWTLYEAVKFDSRGITSRDWETYPILRFDAAPRIQTLILNRPDYPMLGAGEATSGPTPAAIANAVYAAVGLRMRDIPFTPDKVRSALQSL